MSFEYDKYVLHVFKPFYPYFEDGDVKGLEHCVYQIPLFALKKGCSFLLFPELGGIRSIPQPSFSFKYSTQDYNQLYYKREDDNNKVYPLKGKGKALFSLYLRTQEDQIYISMNDEGKTSHNGMTIGPDGNANYGNLGKKIPVIETNVEQYLLKLGDVYSEETNICISDNGNNYHVMQVFLVKELIELQADVDDYLITFKCDDYDNQMYSVDQHRKI